MAFGKALTQRLLNITKISSQALNNCRISSSSVQTRMPSGDRKPDMAPDPGDNGILRRFLHKCVLSQPAFSPELRSHPLGENFMEKLRDIDIARNRIRLDGLSPPAEKSDVIEEGVTVEDARKLLKAAQLELVKTKLRELRQSCIPYSEFLRICGEICSDKNQATRVAKMLDDSADVIILGNVVFLRPEQVAKAIQGLLPVPGSKALETEKKELDVMEKEKAAIDEKAHYLVRRELWCGLGFLVMQTAAFMRLTFWELSWDVMEPICFYVSTMYFTAGYAFFLRTSTEPSFEGFYKSRLNTKQKRLVKLHNFDIDRYSELKAASQPCSSSPSTSQILSSIPLSLNNSLPHH
ncbi:hypothetical protein L6164_019998 [Bauhinia variegata]|uniref:Uncharacterized protein n=1 Tax=Bauhinia variegata TaxID=167791 RepID=A0ACB9MTQ3_BAUVA|nr:hypothetical protein L6164_019998 [Bauhinia variegata]